MKKRIVRSTSASNSASLVSGSWKRTMYMSSPKRALKASIGSTGMRGRKGVLTPTIPAMRSRCSSGIRQTTSPPQSWPTNTAFSAPR